MKKRYLFVKTAIFFTIICSLVLFLILKTAKKNIPNITNILYEVLNSNEQISYNGILEVINELSDNKVVVKLNNDISSEFVLYSSKFKIGDQIKINYLVEENSIIIKGIENYNITDENKEQIIDLIPLDFKKYKDQIKIYANKKLLPINFKFIPIRIANQYYITMGSIDYLLIYNSYYDGIEYAWQLDDKPVIHIDGDYKIISFINIPYLDGYNNQNVKEVKYNIKNKLIYFEHMNNGIYELIIELENNDIIKILFF